MRLNQSNAQQIVDAMACGKLDDAWRMTQKLLRSNGAHPFLLSIAGAIKVQAGQYEDGLSWLRRAIAVAPEDFDILNNLGTALDATGRSHEAHPYLVKAASIRPQDPRAANNLALASLHLGDRTAAEAGFRKAVTLAPAYADAWRHLAEMISAENGDTIITEMEHVLKDPGLPPDAQAKLHFALGKAFDDVGARAKAYSHFRTGNSIMAVLQPYDHTEMQRLFDAMRDAFPSGSALEKRQATAEPRLIFVVGMPRSGTTLVEQILGRHHAVHAAGELDYLRDSVKEVVKSLMGTNGFRIRRTHLQEIASRYRQQVTGRAESKPVLVDKMPLNFRFVGLIAEAFPDALLINVDRDPQAVAWSVFRTFFPASGMRFSWDMDAIRHMQELHEESIGYWTEQYGERVHRLSYDALTENPEARIRDLLEFCALPFDPACLAPHESGSAVTTASTLQVRKPIYKGSSRAWQNYAPFIEESLPENA